MIKCTLVFYDKDGNPKTGEGEINQNFCKYIIIKELVKELDLGDYRDYTLAVDIPNPNTTMDRIKAQEGCTLYLLKIPSQITKKFKWEE